MKIVSFFASFLDRLNLRESLIHPDKKIAGKWQLYEYYTESNNQLFHFNRSQIKQDGKRMVIEFTEEGEFTVHANLELPVLNEEDDLKWNRQRNFISIYRSGFPDSSTEFQFAFQKDNFKLLNKNTAGEIQFFGFFSRPSVSDKK